jgi:hypothetical protein
MVETAVLDLFQQDAEIVIEVLQRVDALAQRGIERVGRGIGCPGLEGLGLASGAQPGRRAEAEGGEGRVAQTRLVGIALGAVRSARPLAQPRVIGRSGLGRLAWRSGPGSLVCRYRAKGRERLRGDRLRALPDRERLAGHAPCELEGLGPARERGRLERQIDANVRLLARGFARCILTGQGPHHRLHGTHRPPAHRLEARGIGLGGGHGDHAPRNRPRHLAPEDRRAQAREPRERLPDAGPLAKGTGPDAEPLAAVVAEGAKAEALVAVLANQDEGQHGQAGAQQAAGRDELADAAIGIGAPQEDARFGSEPEARGRMGERRLHVAPGGTAG